MEFMVSDPRIIVSLDFANEKDALDLARTLDPERCRLKVGKELFTHFGPAIVVKLMESGFDIFLDLKFHDIPNTVARACKAAAELGVWMLNIHASGGSSMLRAAREAIDQSSHQPLLIAVTVLTSMLQRELKETGIDASSEKQVMRLAGLAHEAGLDGVICSAQEASQLRKAYGNGFRLVSPGIRPAGSARDDQKRVVTPAAAIRAGCDYLVIGRPITLAPDPLAVLSGIEEEIRNQAESKPV